MCICFLLGEGGLGGGFRNQARQPACFAFHDARQRARLWSVYGKSGRYLTCLCCRLPRSRPNDHKTKQNKISLNPKPYKPQTLPSALTAPSQPVDHPNLWVLTVQAPALPGPHTLAFGFKPLLQAVAAYSDRLKVVLSQHEGQQTSPAGYPIFWMFPLSYRVGPRVLATQRNLNIPFFN